MDRRPVGPTQSSFRALQLNQGGTFSVVMEEFRDEAAQNNDDVPNICEVIECSLSKRGAKLCDMKINQSPQKISKNIESKEERKKRVVVRLRSMCIKERYLMIEKTLNTKEELLEILK